MVEYIELNEPVEKVRVKKVLSEAQLANLQKGRDRKKELQAASAEDKMAKKLEDRFDKLLTVFEAVRLPPPEVQEQLKATKAKVRRPPPESDDEEEEEEDAPPPVKAVVKKTIEKRAPVVVSVQPNGGLRFC